MISKEILLAAYKRDYARKWYRSNGSKHHEIQKRYKAKFDNYNREKHLRSNYGISQQRYLEMAEQQNGLCLICHENPLKPLNVDHNHSTGKVRGLLCGDCNRGIGLFKESVLRLESAAHYLKSEDT